jgi:homoprotocatechuate degradation regulator HpaR
MPAGRPPKETMGVAGRIDDVIDELVRSVPEDKSLPQDDSRSVLVMLMRAREAALSYFQPLLAANDLTEQQWRVLRVLGPVEKLEAHEVAARASVLPPSLTRIVNVLEQRRLVRRIPSLEDRRRLYLSLTDSGLDLVVQLTSWRSSAYRDLVAQFGHDRLELLLELLAELAQLGRPQLGRKDPS